MSKRDPENGPEYSELLYLCVNHWCRVPQATRKACEAAGAPYRDSLHAAGHALLNVMPLYVICNPSDIRTECENPYAVRYRPERLLLYDTHPGGLGLSAKVCIRRSLFVLYNPGGDCSIWHPTSCPNKSRTFPAVAHLSLCHIALVLQTCAVFRQLFFVAVVYTW